jgi:hypothetical protein
MSQLSYQLDPSGTAAPQTQSGASGAADVNVIDGVVGILQDQPGYSNAVTVQPTPYAVAGPLNASTAALAASLVVKVGAARLLRVTGVSTNVGAQFIQLHDAASLPANAVVPKVVVSVAAGAPFSIDFGIYGRLFTTGIVICNSSTAATKTIGSADCLFDVQFV